MMMAMVVTMVMVAMVRSVEVVRLTQNELLREAARTEVINRRSLKLMMFVEEEERITIFSYAVGGGSTIDNFGHINKITSKSLTAEGIKAALMGS